ncbi:hypothetical protein LguiB_021341 [Lonicera macranthoides]
MLRIKGKSNVNRRAYCYDRRITKSQRSRPARLLLPHIYKEAFTSRNNKVFSRKVEGK